MRGRKPDPKVAKGALTRAPKAPTYLAREAREEWRRVVPIMVATDTLKAEDLPLVEALVIARGRIRELEREIQARMMASEDFAPLARLQNTTSQLATRLAAELYLTPASRSRPSAQAADDADDLADLGLAA